MLRKLIMIKSANTVSFWLRVWLNEMHPIIQEWLKLRKKKHLPGKKHLKHEI